MQAVNKDTAPKAPSGPLQRVMQMAAHIFDLEVDEIHSAEASKHLMPVRFAVALALKRNGMSTTIIARALKRKDHTTAIYWLRQADKRVEEDETFAHAVELIANVWASPAASQQAVA